MNNSVDVSQLLRGAFLFVGLLVALAFGILVGEAKWSLLGAIGALVVLAAIAQFTVVHLATVCLLLSVLDFWMAPLGFKIGPMEQTGIVAAFAWLLVCWRRNFNLLAPKQFMELGSWRLYNNVVLVAAAYAITHFIYNLITPYDELAFGWRGASKAYSQTFGAFFMVLILARTRLLFDIGRKRSVAILWLFLLALVVCVGIGVARAIVIGPEPETGLSLEEKSSLHRLFTIPGINAYDNVYTLRQLGPASVLIGATFFFVRPVNVPGILPLLIFSFGFFGSLVSAGRATIIIAVLFLGLAMVRSRRAPLAFALGGAVAIAAAILLFLPSSFFKEAPWHVQRSVGWLRPDLKTDATEGIAGSSDMRWRYFHFAWEHYTAGDARLILFGRSVGQLDSVDVLSFVLYNEPAQMEFAVRRLATHNGLTDLLLGWGLIGYLLILAMCISCIAMLFRYLRCFDRNSHGACWVFSAAVFLLYWLIYTHIGGSFVWPLAIALTLVALSQTDGLVKATSSTSGVTSSDFDSDDAKAKDTGVVSRPASDLILRH